MSDASVAPASDLAAGPLLKVVGLNLAIGATPLLHQVSLEVGPGEIVGVIGESGSGKSLTALGIMGLLPQGASASGRVLFAGSDLLALPERSLCAIRGRDIGMIFQEPMSALNPLQTIGDQVAETVRVHTRTSRAEAMSIAGAALGRAGLPTDRVPPSRYPHELSGGQRQRATIAAATALRPRLLIADEPTTALDVTTQAGILDLLRSLVVHDRMGLILISHDLAVVARMADRLVIMREGRIVDGGPTPDVFARLAHPYTRALLRASNHVPRRVPRIERHPLLVVENLVREHASPRRRWLAPKKGQRVVDRVTFALRRGESLGLVGESGCGKSTLARAVLGLEPLQGGRISLDGELVTSGRRMPARVRTKIQGVFQDPYGSFNPRHRVARLVAEPFHLLAPRPDRTMRRRAVEEALDAVGLQPADMDKYIHEFSGGQRQRIAIARALVIRPRLIVLDEAVSALDVSIRAQILDLLADLSTRFSLSYLFISHDLGVVRAITDRVLVMRSGSIVEEGPTEAVFAAPRHPYTSALLAAVPML